MRNLAILVLFIVVHAPVMSESGVPLNYKKSIDGNEQLSHKYRMASYLLIHSPLPQRMLNSDDNNVKDLLSQAKSNFDLVKDKIDNKNWLEANAIIDSVLRDLTAGAQLLNVENAKNRRYHEELRRLESFVLPEWKKLSDNDLILLEKSLASIDEFHIQAKKEAYAGDYDRAADLLQKAYTIKSSLIKRLKHEETIVYDLMFDTQDEEYTYMVNRTKHYMGLVKIVLDKKDINAQTKNLIDTYLYQSNESLIKAEKLRENDRHLKAVEVLTESVSLLSNALKIMGIKI